MKYVLLSLKSIIKKDKTEMKYYITDNIILFFQKNFLYNNVSFSKSRDLYIEEFL